MKILISLFSIFLMSACSSYINSIHRQIDSEERVRAQRLRQAQYARGQRGIQNPVTLGGTPTAGTQKNLLPGVKRNYTTQGTRRYRANDLVDNDGDGSLWSGKNSESFLFVNSNLKRKGDIVIVEVMKGLKDNIQDELRRAFPERKKTSKSKKKGAKEETDKAAEAPAAGKPAQDSPDKVYDKISTNVIEEVNQDYVLVRGRKEVLYKKYKRYFEFQAVVSQKDITSRDSVASPKLLEPKINILRY